MAQVTIYNIDGVKAGNIELPDEVFSVKVNPDLVHEAIIAQEENSRVKLANTKDRSEVRGGGRKPWRQKGTGRARHGSRRSPIWIGGGVTFGPNLLRVFGKKINKKAKRKALKMVLSDKIKDEKLIVVENFEFDVLKTRKVAEMREKLPGHNSSALIVADDKNKAIKFAARNLPKTDAIGVNSLNVRDLVKYEYLILSKDAAEKIKEIYS
ncbi:50S ribosomal protein L4 [Candidatus Parcubacteria bacterium]|nr:MAG: 50S ribosomal protein L4 [Candidatus Parcubacteria bacterium]